MPLGRMLGLGCAFPCGSTDCRHKLTCRHKHAQAHLLVPVALPTRQPCRLTKAVAEGKGKKGADAALRAAGLGMADKAVGVRDAGSALLQEMMSQLGQEALVGAAGLLGAADKKLAMEALSKVLGGPVTAAPGAGAAASAVASSAAARPGTAAGAAKAPTARPGTRAGTGRGAAAPALSAAPVVAAEPAAPVALLAYNEGKADRARKVRFGQMQCGACQHCLAWTALLRRTGGADPPAPACCTTGRHLANHPPARPARPVCACSTAPAPASLRA